MIRRKQSETDRVQSIENRKFNETKEEKQQFICESFHLDANEILNANEKLKKAFLDFGVGDSFI